MITSVRTKTLALPDGYRIAAIETFDHLPYVDAWDFELVLERWRKPSFLRRGKWVRVATHRVGDTLLSPAMHEAEANLILLAHCGRKR